MSVSEIKIKRQASFKEREWNKDVPLNVPSEVLVTAAAVISAAE